MKYLLIINLLTFIGCQEHHHESLVQKLKKQEFKEVSPPEDQILKNRLDGIKYQKSKWRKKSDFFVEERFDQFKLNKCQDCHSKNGYIPSNANNHEEIVLNHAPSETMSCTTCHQKKETWNLHLLRGETVSINHQYKLCSQCHTEQVHDWANGAHGKKLGGWYGKRVIKACTSCHNPHAPQFHKQMPKVVPNFLKYKK